MKTTKIKISVYTLITVLSFALIFSSCTKDDELNTPMATSSQSSNDLNVYEQIDLLYLVEKEKFHTDVYQSIIEANQLSFMGQLCSCDEDFMARLSIKLEKYGIDNPVADLPRGEYTDTRLQVLFNDFETIDLSNNAVAISYAKDMESEILVEMQQILDQLNGNEDLRNLYLEIQVKSEGQLEELQSFLKSNPGYPIAGVVPEIDY